ncbi:MAG: 3-oxoacyl-ACP reductase FabG [Nitrososphaeraceae archaeon]|nr:3-oxoacyl-ACP reductase FabG [Nitrososphaeraceae archaeon]
MSENKKVAVVTGSSKGIGKAIALAFANSNEYYGIVVNSRKPNEAQYISEQIKSSNSNCDSISITADISKEEDCIRLIEETIQHYKRIDVLVNNAGIQKDIPLTETTLSDWYQIISVDLTGPFVCSREAVRYMQKQQDPKGGCIINISSVHQVIPKPHYVPYATSKAGIEMMTKTMALELAKYGIRANVVAPGAVETDMNIELQTNKVELENVLKRIPVGRIGKPEEIANVVEFLASDKARYVTGTTVLVDGGMTLYPSFAYNSEHDKIKHSEENRQP